MAADMDGEITATKQRGRPFAPGMSGNPAGRPKGARNRATVAAEALLEGEAEALTRKAVELALAGDVTALRLCLERVVPPRKDRAVAFDLPAVGQGRRCGASARCRAGGCCGRHNHAERGSRASRLDRSATARDRIGSGPAGDPAA